MSRGIRRLNGDERIRIEHRPGLQNFDRATTETSALAADALLEAAALTPIKRGQIPNTIANDPKPLPGTEK